MLNADNCVRHLSCCSFRLRLRERLLRSHDGMRIATDVGERRQHQHQDGRGLGDRLKTTETGKAVPGGERIRDSCGRVVAARRRRWDSQRRAARLRADRTVTDETMTATGRTIANGTVVHRRFGATVVAQRQRQARGNVSTRGGERSGGGRADVVARAGRSDDGAP